MKDMFRVTYDTTPARPLKRRVSLGSEGEEELRGASQEAGVQGGLGWPGDRSPGVRALDVRPVGTSKAENRSKKNTCSC